MITIACVKVGDKYGPAAVNHLYEQCKTKFTIPFHFVCYTDNATGIDTDISIVYEPKYAHLTGSWNKMALFAPGVLSGPVVYFDLDVVLPRNCDKLAREVNSHRLLLLDSRRKYNKITNIVQHDSSVMVFESRQVAQIWTRFNRSQERHMTTHSGMDMFLWKQCNQSIDYITLEASNFGTVPVDVPIEAKPPLGVPSDSIKLPTKPPHTRPHFFVATEPKK